METIFINTYNFKHSKIRKFFDEKTDLTICSFNKEEYILHILNSMKENKKIIFDGLDNIEYKDYDKYSLMNYIRILANKNNFSYEVL